MVYLKAGALYVEIGGTKVTSAHSETMEILRTGKICKTRQKQIILQMQIATQTPTQIV